MQRILLVEDNEMNRDLISRRLKRRGFDVSLAVDGAEGVEKATSELPDLIIMDIGLPVLDGYEATRLLRETDATRRIPIIGLSAHAMSGDARKALAAGCDDYDTKPVEWSRLLGKIEVQLKRVQEEAALQGDAEDAAPEEAAVADPNAAHLLVIDDSAMHREMLSGRLASLGYTFDLAGEVQSALSLLQEKTFDAVLLDVTLPTVEGQPMLEWIRADSRWQDLPILMLSTVDTVRAAIDCLSRGAVDFVPQPFHAEVLKARIDACLDRSRIGQRLRQVEDELASEKRRSEHLLHTLLPDELVQELRETNKILPRRVDGVALLTCDVAGFRQASDALEPEDAVRRLQRIFLAFEEIIERHGLTKIRTSGDTFAAAGGLFAPSPAAASIAVRCGLEMREACSQLEAEWPLRVGAHIGPVIVGVAGYRKAQFDLWGAAVRTAVRVRRSGQPGALHVSEAAWQQLAEQVTGQRLGEAKLEDGGTVTIYRVDRLAD
ncbi:MAG: response regulator [Acidobacteriota bacterium]